MYMSSPLRREKRHSEVILRSVNYTGGGVARGRGRGEVERERGREGVQVGGAGEECKWEGQERSGKGARQGRSASGKGRGGVERGRSRGGVQVGGTGKEWKEGGAEDGMSER